MKRLLPLVWTSLLLVLAACQQESPPETMWLPTLENASFHYLADTATRIEQAVFMARQRLDERDLQAARKKLLQAEEELLILRHYDIPMTEVRQRVYDAERFFALRLFGKADGDLAHADRLLDQIGASSSTVVLEEIDPVRLQISEVRITIGELQRQAPDLQKESIEAAGKALQELGNRINLMTVKADLVLSGADFQMN